MTATERLRIKILSQMADGPLSLAEGAAKLGLSYRQMRRLRQVYLRDGDGGVVHRLRGKTSNRLTKSAVRERVMTLCRGTYAGFGPTLVCEYLLKLDEPIVLSHDTVRRWLAAEELMPRTRRRGKHRSRRERRSRAGAMVQMDGSWHEWFEERGPWCCLMVMIDDATGRVWARFYDRETLGAAFDIFRRYAAARGLPVSLYVDRAGIYRSDKEPTLAQELAGERPPTQFGRAMKQLDVELILANSPQAKGRVERMNGTLQDRLVKAMRLAGIGDIASANQFLDETFLAPFNEQFAVTAAEAIDAHRAVSVDLCEVLCEHHERKVGRDWCVQWRGTLLQIDPVHEALSLTGKAVTLQEAMDGTLRMLWQGKALLWKQVSQRPRRLQPKAMIVNNKPWKPAAAHPWRSTSATVARASSPTAPRPLPR